MNKNALTKIVVAVALLWPALVQSRPKSHPLDEDTALNILLRTLQRDHVYDKRISLDCVTFDTDDTTRTYFEFALREKHNAKCGGDPETNPVVDRYRVQRGYGKIDWYDAVENKWQSYDPKRVK